MKKLIVVLLLLAAGSAYALSVPIKEILGLFTVAVATPSASGADRVDIAGSTRVTIAGATRVIP